MELKRQRNSSSSDSSLSGILEKLNKAKISKKTGDAQKLEIDMRAKQLQPKDVKRVPKRPEPLELLDFKVIKKDKTPRKKDKTPRKKGKRTANARTTKKATSGKNNKKAATDRTGTTSRTGISGRTGITGRPRSRHTQSEPNLFKQYRSPKNFNSSSRSSSSARRKLPVYRGTHNRATDDIRKNFNLQFPDEVLERLKKMDVS